MTQQPIEPLEMAEILKMDLAKMMLVYAFDMNDQELREKVVENYTDFLSKRDELNDYTLVCDESNNTEDRIAANELWVDVAVQYYSDEPFIYIPLRLSKTGIN